MKPRLFVEEAARADLADAFRWYEGQRAGLGSEFLAALPVVFERIEENPMAYPIIRGTTRRVLLRRFPYSVFYVVDPDLVAVTAVMHGRRDPRRWQERR
jgi:plasmid stabilization system protein ParE